jgi:putative endonuclease
MTAIAHVVQSGIQKPKSLQSRKLDQLRSKTLSSAARWYVYLLLCKDGTQYCGISTDVTKRLKSHNTSGIKGAKYTRSRRPCTLLCSVGPITHSDALKLEYAVKQQSAKEKQRFVECGLTYLAQLV